MVSGGWQAWLPEVGIAQAYGLTTGSSHFMLCVYSPDVHQRTDKDDSKYLSAGNAELKTA